MANVYRLKSTFIDYRLVPHKVSPSVEQAQIQQSLHKLHLRKLSRAIHIQVVENVGDVFYTQRVQHPGWQDWHLGKQTLG